MAPAAQLQLRFADNNQASPSAVNDGRIQPVSGPPPPQMAAKLNCKRTDRCQRGSHSAVNKWAPANELAAGSANLDCARASGDGGGGGPN